MALALSAIGCAFEVDYAGTRFQCQEAADCPGGSPCTDGYCQYTGDGEGEGGGGDEPVGGAGDEGDDDLGGGTPGGDGELGGDRDAPIEWRAAAVGAYDNLLLDDVSTSGELEVEAGDLLIAVVSLKPRRTVELAEGLGLAWHEVRQQCSGRNTAEVAMYWARADAAASGAVSLDLAGAAVSGSALLLVQRYSGADAELPVGAATWANTTGHDGDVACAGGVDTAGYAWASLDTGAPGSVVLAAAHTSSYKTHQPGAGYVERDDRQSGTTPTSAGLAVEESRLEAASSDVMVSGSWATEPDWAVVAIEIRD